MFPREQLLYTRCYCEENVYKLCLWVKENMSDHLDRLSVVFISNPDRRIPLWEQSSAVEGNPVVWDYHVILLTTNDDSELIIYDFDTRLPFPTPLQEYVSLTFRPELQLPSQFQRWFRLLPGKEFLLHFASDRSHMLRDGDYIMPPPEYPCISTADETMNLDTFIDMTENLSSSKYGIVLDERSFFTYCLQREK